MDHERTRRYVDTAWQESILSELVDYIRIPNKSPHFDPDWAEHGYMETVVERFRRWAAACPVAGLQVEVVRLQGRTPLLYMEVPGDAPGTVVLYGHLDKQPEMSGWRQGLGPWEPVLEGDRLYGRGGADDGYAMFASLTAIAAVQDQGLPHARCVILIEACEESGSYDLPPYIEALSARIGEPDLVVCLDSGCGNYEQLWCTTSLRGMLGGELRVEVMTEGVHSGDAGGVVPDSFRLLRQILDRVEDPRTGAIRLAEFHSAIPEKRLAQARQAAKVLGPETCSRFPLVPGLRPESEDPQELILNRTWRPALAITGADGLPTLGSAGNVLRAATAVKLSLRLPPNLDPGPAAAALEAALTADPPHQARVSYRPGWQAGGWDAPATAPWLERALDQASRAFFGRPCVYMGEGGSIPFMGMLGARFPRAQFLVTGVLGPQANAHGPNEFLHLPTARRLTACVARVLADHAVRPA